MRSVPLLAAAALAISSIASADEKEACIAAHAETQRARKMGEIAAAHANARRCAAFTCPSAIRAECVGWVDELEAMVPTIVVVAQVDAADVADVRVSIDGNLVTERLDGRAIALDPGEHLVRVERAGAPSMEKKLLVVQSDRLRRIEFSWRTTSPTQPRPIAAVTPPLVKPDAAPTHSSGLPTASWILGGVGVAGLASFATFAVRGRIRQADLEASCAPACAAVDVSRMRRDYLVADVSLAVAIVSLGGAAWIWLARPTDAARPPATTVSAIPLIGGGLVTFATPL